MRALRFPSERTRVRRKRLQPTLDNASILAGNDTVFFRPGDGKCPLVRCKHLDYLSEDFGIRGNDLAAVQIRVISQEIAHETAGLQDEQAPRRDIPGIEADFPEAVVI